MTKSDPPFLGILGKTVMAFRLGMEGQGSQNFVEVIDFITPFIQNPNCPDRKNISILLSGLLDAQSRRDYLYLADLLEYRLSYWITKNISTSST